MPEDTQPSQPSNEAAPKSAALINKSHVKAYALARGQLREWKPTRVSQTFMDAVEENTRLFIEARVENHPPSGKTLQ